MSMTGRLHGLDLPMKTGLILLVIPGPKGLESFNENREGQNHQNQRRNNDRPLRRNGPFRIHMF